MAKSKIPPIPSSEITGESVWLRRRAFIGGGATVAGAAGVAGVARAAAGLRSSLALAAGAPLARALTAGSPLALAAGAPSALALAAGAPLDYRPAVPEANGLQDGTQQDNAHQDSTHQSDGIQNDGHQNKGFYTPEPLTPYSDVTRYNNFYEFGTNKGDPARHAHNMQTDPWTLQVDGEVAKPGALGLEDIQAGFDLEERIYRLRCVEAWSMVVPWVGYPLAALLRRFEPTSRAKYVKFQTLVRRSEMRGTRSLTSIIDWPYVEGLRLDEAMHPLTFLAVGLYGKVLPNQNGAPLRLVVPWKYGFKSIKSIVRITLTQRRPKSSWELIAPQEYGFYANVNPAVDHPRWSQKTERRLPSSLFSPNRIDTQPFNGYAPQVAHLYDGMDLRRHY